MQNDRIQGILFDRQTHVDLRALSASKSRRVLLKTLVSKYGIQNWRLRSPKPQLPQSPYVVVHKGKSRNAELAHLTLRIKVRD